MTAAYLVTGVRTPFGRYGGALAAVRPDDLAAHVLRALAERRFRCKNIILGGFLIILTCEIIQLKKCDI